MNLTVPADDDGEYLDNCGYVQFSDAGGCSGRADSPSSFSA